MGRILEWFLLAAIIYALVRSQMRSRAGAPSSTRSQRSAASAGSSSVLQCAYCGIHFPDNEVVRAADGRGFCGAEHARLALDASHG